jgi:endonuclease/exonuclease/phosphatase family metal-dependent hydrolase
MHCFSTIRLTLFALFLSACNLPAVEPLLVMSYNVRVPIDGPPNSWAERRPGVAACIRQASPDLIGTQEGIESQLADMVADLPEYAMLGHGREGGKKGEFSALLYRKDRITPLDHGDFWLSETPHLPGSKTWGNQLPRMVTWARCRDEKAGREFVWFNTHFDHQSQPSREKSSALLLDRVRAAGATLPVIVTGDFNAAAGANPAHAILVADGTLRDTWIEAATREGEGINTFNRFETEPIRGDSRIDWILLRGPLRASHAAILTFQHNGRFPSDHFPVIARLHWEN